MLKNKKSIFAIMLVASMVSCNTPVTETKNNGEVKDSVKVADTVDSSKNGGTLKFAVWDGAVTDYWRVVSDGFEKANVGSKVELVDIPSADYIDKITIMMSSGDDTDIISVKTMPQLAGLISKNQIMPLTESIAKDNIDLSVYSGVMDNIKVNDLDYGLPFRSDIWLLFYNKTIFDKAGIKYPNAELTWEGYRELAKKLTTGEGNDKIYGAYTHTWTSAVVNSALPESQYNLFSGKYEFLKPSYELFLGMQNTDKTTMEFGSLKTANIHYSGPFYKEQIAMLPMGSWFINSIINTKSKGETNVDWGFTTIPHWEGKEAGNTIGGITPFSINTNTKNSDLSWEFLKFACGEEGATILASLGVKPAYTAPAVLDTLSSVEGFPVECKDALTVKSITMDSLPVENAAAINSVLDEEHELIMLGATTIDEGLKEMETRIGEIK